MGPRTLLPKNHNDSIGVRKISLEEKTLHLKDWSVGNNPLVKSTGNMTIDENGVSNFEAKVEAKDVKTDNGFSLFGYSFKKGLSGDVKIFDAR